MPSPSGDGGGGFGCEPTNVPSPPGDGGGGFGIVGLYGGNGPGLGPEIGDDLCCGLPNIEPSRAPNWWRWWWWR